MAAPSPRPVRFTSGVSTDPVFGPLASYGQPNPFMYHAAFDDFDWTQSVTSRYTVTANTNGAAALAAADGGTVVLTTNSSTPLTTDIVSMQMPIASFTFTAGKKSFFLVRLKTSSAANAAFIVGLIQTTTTPFTVTDGLYFSKATGGTALTIKLAASSTITTFTIPTSAYTLADNTYIDMGFEVNRNQDIVAFVGSQLVGWLPQSGSGSVDPVSGVSLLPALGPCLINSQGSNALTWPSATLNPTIAVQSGTASSKTMTVDFAMAAKER